MEIHPRTRVSRPARLIDLALRGLATEPHSQTLDIRHHQAALAIRSGDVALVELGADVLHKVHEAWVVGIEPAHASGDVGSDVELRRYCGELNIADRCERRADFEADATELQLAMAVDVCFLAGLEHEFATVVDAVVDVELFRRRVVLKAMGKRVNKCLGQGRIQYKGQTRST